MSPVTDQERDDFKRRIAALAKVILKLRADLQAARKRASDLAWDLTAERERTS